MSSEQLPMGPSDTAPWQEVISSNSLPLLLLPDVGNNISIDGLQVYYTLPQAPRLVRDFQGVPVSSLTLLLDRQPKPDETTIVPLVKQSFLNFDVTLEVPLPVVPNQIYQLLFARTVIFELYDNEGHTLATATTSGDGARVALQTSLDRKQTLELLSALNDMPSSLYLRVSITYRTVRIQQSNSVLPSDSMMFTVANIRNKQLNVSLNKVLGEALVGMELERFISLMAPNGEGGIGTVPWRIKSDVLTSKERNDNNTHVPLVVKDGRLESVALSLRPNTFENLSKVILLNNGAKNSNVSATVKPIWLDDLLFLDEPQHLPLVENVSAWLWPDGTSSSVFWYPPTFQVILPKPGTEQEADTFLFSFERTGATASGHPALLATVRFTIQPVMHKETEEALTAQGHPNVKQVPLEGLTIALEIPFVDEADGQTKSNIFWGSVEQKGNTYTFSISLLNEWVQLCYGALSQQGFQKYPARLHVAYNFQAFVSLVHGSLVFGNKNALIPLSLENGLSIRYNSAFINTTSLSREKNLGTLNYSRSDRSLIVAKPVLNQPTIILDRYAVQSLVRSEQIDVFLPCNTFPDRYRELVGGASTTIGCQDALSLGHIMYKQYVELTELSHPLYRVYISQQQPRFLVVPSTYRITRFDPNQGIKAYKPTILLYALLDSQTEANDKVVFQAFLEPDLPEWVRRELLYKLIPFNRSPGDPIVDYPTTIESEMTCTWTVASLSTVDAVREPNGLRVALTTDINRALLVRDMLRHSGVHGTAYFKLHDGTEFLSSIALELNNITGPWEKGPVEVIANNGVARLTNHIERPVTVSDLMFYLGPNSSVEQGKPVPVEKTLSAGQSIDVAVTENTSYIYPVWSLPAGEPAELEEIRSVIEDVETNIIFIDSIDHAKYGLQGLEIEARLEGIEGTKHLELTNKDTSDRLPTGEVRFFLPLTSYLQQPILEFQVTKLLVDGQASVMSWLEWDLKTKGHIITIDWNLINKT